MSSEPGFFDRMIARQPAMNCQVLAIDWEAGSRPSESEGPTIRFFQGLGPEARLIGETSARELGLPPRLGPPATLLADRPDTVSEHAWLKMLRYGPVFPEPLRYRLRDAFPGDELFLRFLSRDGYLASFAWEASLWSACLTVKRLAYYLPLPGRSVVQTMAVILDPSAAPSIIFQRAVADINLYLDRGEIERCHIFGPTEEFVPPAWARSDFGRIVFHPAPDTGLWEPRESAEPHEYRAFNRVRHPWLNRILDELGDEAVDSVAFAGTATIDGVRGMLVLDDFVAPSERLHHGSSPGPARATRPRPWSPMVDADELTAFVSALGCSAVAFVQYDADSLNVLAFRTLADAVTQRIPVPCEVIDPFSGWDYWKYWIRVGSLFYRGDAEDGEKLVRRYFPPSVNDGMRRQLARFTIHEPLERALSDGRKPPLERALSDGRKPPRWQIAAQRTLEAWLARILDEGGEFDDIFKRETSAGQAEALEKVADTLRRFIET
jgi:hypothetical protein